MESERGGGDSGRSGASSSTSLPGSPTPSIFAEPDEPSLFDRDLGSAVPSAIAPYFGVDDHAGPFAPEINAALGASFGSSLANISVSRGADTALGSIGADAATAGRHIALASTIREDTDDAQSMNVIAHEVAHALAGGGTGDDFLDDANDPGEAIAYGAGDAFGAFIASGMRGAPPRLSAASGGRAQIHRHSLAPPSPFTLFPGMPWLQKVLPESMGKQLRGRDPVHEDLTLATLATAGLLKPGDEATPTEYLKGARWNDDPEMKMFHDPPKDAGIVGKTVNAMKGLLGFRDVFNEGEEEAANGKEHGPGDALTKRSHFGDLSFIHGMAAKDGEKPEDTQNRMLMWAEFTSKVASGQLAGDSQVGALALNNPEFKRLLQSDPNLAKKSINEMFGVKDGEGDVRMRASGSLLHMIQDSYAGGHTAREKNPDGSLGAISAFHAYGNQDHDLHKNEDAAPPGDGTHLQRALAKPGSLNAVHDGAMVMRMLAEGKGSDDVVKFLRSNTFKLSPNAMPGDTGAGYQKPASPPVPEAQLPIGPVGPAGPTAPVLKTFVREDKPTPSRPSGPTGPVGPAGPTAPMLKTFVREDKPAAPAAQPLPMGPVGPAGDTGPKPPPALSREQPLPVGPVGPAGSTGPKPPAPVRGANRARTRATDDADGSTGAVGPAGNTKP